MEQHPRSTQTRAAARAQWLARLAEALDEAHRLAGLLGAHRGRVPEAKALRLQIQAACAEVEAIRRGTPAEFTPEWIQAGRKSRLSGRRPA